MENQTDNLLKEASIILDKLDAEDATDINVDEDNQVHFCYRMGGLKIQVTLNLLENNQA